MRILAKTAALVRKAVSIVSAPFRTSDAAGYRSSLSGSGGGDPGVTVDTAMQLSVIFAGVRLVAQTVATLPLVTYRRKRDGSREVAYDHPLYSVLHDSPNADQTAVEFWEEVITSMALRGRAYIHKAYDVNDNITALTPLHPDRMGAPYYERGVRVYPYNHPTRGRINYPDREIWVQRGYCDMSVIQYGARSMGAATNAERTASKLYGNDMRPAFVTIIKDFLSKPQRAQMKEAIADGIGGSVEQGGRFRLLEGGPEFKQLALSPEDAQLLETRQFSVEELCRWIGVPPSMIGHGTAVSNWGTGREQINLSFLQYVLGAYTERLEQGITKWLIKPEERRRIYSEFNVEGLLRADSAGRASFYSTALQNGWMTRNEVRQLENWPTVKGGNDLTVQSNLVPLSLLGQDTANSGAQGAINALKNALGITEKVEEKANELPH